MEDNENITLEQVQEDLLKYQEDSVVKELNNVFKEKSFLEILGVERKENYHSNFLAWLFGDEETSCVAVERLLLLLVKRKKQFNCSHFPEELKNDILTGSFKVETTKVDRETVVDDGRTDLNIKINSDQLTVIVENKVQTRRYWDYYNESQGKMLFVYLTPLGTNDLNGLTEPECICKEFIQINYQDLLESILLPLSKDEQVSERKKILLQEYIKSLAITENGTIMAMEDAVRSLLLEFWKNHQELIKKAMSALIQDQNADSDTKASVTQAINMMKNVDNTRYSVNNEGEYARGACVKKVAEIFLGNDGKKDEFVLDNKYNEKINIILTKQEYQKRKDSYRGDKKTKEKKRWQILEVGKESYYVRVDWQKANFANFFEAVNEWGRDKNINVKALG